MALFLRILRAAIVSCRHRFSVLYSDKEKYLESAVDTTLWPWLRWHNTFKARMIKYYRTREVEKVFRAAHISELASAPVNTWPLVKSRHSEELAQIRAGKLDITDRKSWQYPYMPSSVSRIGVPVLKAIPYNIRKMSRSPVPRRAINLLRNSMLAQPYDIVPVDETDNTIDKDEQEQRIKIAKGIFTRPNNDDSFATWLEKGFDDFCCFGAFASEMQFTLNPLRPIKMWSVNVDTIRLFPNWLESVADTYPRYAQMTGLKGERGAILFYDDEFLYVKDNEANDSPFGMGCMEIAFAALNHLIGTQEMAGKASTTQVHRSWLWWEQAVAPSKMMQMRQHLQNEAEGQAKLSMFSGMQAPQVIATEPTMVEELLIPWQEMLIRMVANAFDLSAMALGIEHDVNRAVGQVLDDKDFRSAVVPRAKRFATAFTNRILHNLLGWYDLKFVFTNLEDPDMETKIDIFRKRWDMNSCTPNEVRVACGESKRDDPFDDMTGFQQQLMLVQAEFAVQQQSADAAMQRSLTQAQNMQQLMGPQVPGQPGQASRPGASAPPPQKAMPIKVPMPPRVGLTAAMALQIAKMPLRAIIDFCQRGVLPMPMRLLANLQQQNSNILEQMDEEARSFFEQIEEIVQNEPQAELTPQMLRNWAKQQLKKRLNQRSRVSDYTTWSNLPKNQKPMFSPTTKPSKRRLPMGPGNTNSN